MSILYWKNRYKNLGGFKTVGNKAWDYKTYQIQTKKLFKFFESKLEKGESVLDFGCGIGRFIPLLKKFYSNYYGTDIIKNISGNFIPIQNGKILTSRKFSAIFSCVVLQHIDTSSLLYYFSQFFHLLKSGGYIYIYELVGDYLTFSDKHTPYLFLRPFYFYFSHLTTSQYQAIFSQIISNQGETYGFIKSRKII